MFRSASETHFNSDTRYDTSSQSNPTLYLPFPTSLVQEGMQSKLLPLLPSSHLGRRQSRESPPHISTRNGPDPQHLHPAFFTLSHSPTHSSIPADVPPTNKANARKKKTFRSDRNRGGRPTNRSPHPTPGGAHTRTGSRAGRARA